MNIGKLTRLIWEENQIYDEYVIRSTYSSPSKEDGRGASDAILSEGLWLYGRAGELV